MKVEIYHQIFHFPTSSSFNVSKVWACERKISKILQGLIESTRDIIKYVKKWQMRNMSKYLWSNMICRHTWNIKSVIHLTHQNYGESFSVENYRVSGKWEKSLLTSFNTKMSLFACFFRWHLLAHWGFVLISPPSPSQSLVDILGRQTVKKSQK